MHSYMLIITHSYALIIYYFEIRNNNFYSAAFQWFGQHGQGRTKKNTFIMALPYILIYKSRNLSWPYRIYSYISRGIYHGLTVYTHI